MQLVKRSWKMKMQKGDSYWKCWNAWSTKHLPPSCNISQVLSHYHGRQADCSTLTANDFKFALPHSNLPRSLLWFPCAPKAVSYDIHWLSLICVDESTVVDARPPNSRHQVASKSWSTLHLQRSPWHLPFLREAVRPRDARWCKLCSFANVRSDWFGWSNYSEPCSN